jgi:hypothetical protein
VNNSPTPPRTRSHVPIPHAALIEQVQGTLTGSGLEVVEEAHGLTRDGARYFGLFGLREASSNHTDFQLTVGLRNSHDKSFPAGLVLGARVFVCDNLSFSGQVRLARKHTSMIWRDLPQLTARAVAQLAVHRQKQLDRIDAYKNLGFGDGEAHDFVVRALDARVIPVTTLPGVLKEWREPSHADFYPRTAWSLFNAFTEALKGNLVELPRRTQALHGLMDLECGLAI